MLWRSLPLLLLIVAAWLAPAGVSGSEPRQGGQHAVFLPAVRRPGQQSCNIPQTSYGTLRPISDPTDIPARSHPDLNLAVRGYSPTDAPLQLVQIAGPTDDAAPQLDSLFRPARLPHFSSAHRVNHWDWECDCRTGPISDPPVTLLGMETSRREVIHVPESGYEIGGGYEVLVLYASENRVTLKYTPEDNVVIGYTLHVEDVCVEAELLAIYREMNAAGRRFLPALRAGQPFARARGQQIKVAIRDTGAFLDPRSQKDWWKTHPVP